MPDKKLVVLGEGPLEGELRGRYGAEPAVGGRDLGVEDRPRRGADESLENGRVAARRRITSYNVCYTKLLRSCQVFLQKNLT